MNLYSIHKNHSSVLRNTIILFFTSGCAITSTHLPPLDLSILFNKIFETFLEIIVVIFGFILLNVFWSRIEERRKALPHREYLRTQVKFIESLAKKTLKLLAESYPPEETRRVNDRNNEVKELIKVISTISEAVDKVLTSNYEKLDMRTSQGFAFFHTFIKPTINIISVLITQEIQPHLTEIEANVQNLNKNISKLALYLREINHDLDPSI